jgi:hypothetical protein
VSGAKAGHGHLVRLCGADADVVNAQAAVEVTAGHAPKRPVFDEDTPVISDEAVGHGASPAASGMAPLYLVRT